MATTKVGIWLSLSIEKIYSNCLYIYDESD